MNLAIEIAKQLRQVYVGGNWTAVNLKETVAGINCEQATTKVQSLNTIAALVYHTNYYIAAVMSVLKGEVLSAKDKYSFNVPLIQSQNDWEELLEKTWHDVEACATLIEQLPEQQLSETFTNEKYGSYYRNLHGIVEHTHYHLGQIVLLKKLLTPENETVANP